MFITFWDKKGNYVYNAKYIHSVQKLSDNAYFGIIFHDGSYQTFDYDSSDEAYSLYSHVRQQLQGGM